MALPLLEIWVIIAYPSAFYPTHIGDAIRAESVGIGTVGLRVDFFPKIPIVVILWVGDEEVPASANILFDANAGRILPTEDLSVASGALVRRLTDISRK